MGGACLHLYASKSCCLRYIISWTVDLKLAGLLLPVFGKICPKNYAIFMKYHIMVDLRVSCAIA